MTNHNDPNLFWQVANAPAGNGADGDDSDDNDDGGTLFTFCVVTLHAIGCFLFGVMTGWGIWG